MRKLIYTLLMSVAFAVGCWTARSETTNATLTFYVVSEEKIEGGRFIDTPDLPKVGYIATKPDLAVTNLEKVCPQKMADYAIMGDKNGKHTIVPSPSPPSLAVTLQSEDAKRFTALTERSIGKQLLVMLGEKPLTAPRVMAPIEGGCFLIQFHDQANLKKTEDDLKKLIR
jgi:preprotein translocase subunit SecD